MRVWKKRTAALIAAVLIAGAVSDDSGRTGGVGDTGVNIFPGVLVVSATSSTQQQINEGEQRKQELEDEKNKNEEQLGHLQGEQKSLRR